MTLCAAGSKPAAGPRGLKACAWTGGQGMGSLLSRAPCAAWMEGLQKHMHHECILKSCQGSTFAADRRPPQCASAGVVRYTCCQSVNLCWSYAVLLKSRYSSMQEACIMPHATSHHTISAFICPRTTGCKRVIPSDVHNASSECQQGRTMIQQRKVRTLYGGARERVLSVAACYTTMVKMAWLARFERQ